MPEYRRAHPVPPFPQMPVLIGPSLGRVLAGRLAHNLRYAERKELRAPMRYVATLCDRYLANPAQLPHRAGEVGLSALDRIEPGDALIVYADANPKGWQGAMQTLLSDIEAATRTTLAEARAISLRAHAYRERLAAATDDTARAAEASHQRIELSAVVGYACHGGQTLRNLRALAGTVPIIADTRPYTRTSGSFIHVSAGALLDGLGTIQPAGRA